MTYRNQSKQGEGVSKGVREKNHSKSAASLDQRFDNEDIAKNEPRLNPGERLAAFRTPRPSFDQEVIQNYSTAQGDGNGLSDSSEAFEDNTRDSDDEALQSRCGWNAVNKAANKRLSQQAARTRDKPYGMFNELDHSSLLPTNARKRSRPSRSSKMVPKKRSYGMFKEATQEGSIGQEIASSGEDSVLGETEADDDTNHVSISSSSPPTQVESNHRQEITTDLGSEPTSDGEEFAGLPQERISQVRQYLKMGIEIENGEIQMASSQKWIDTFTREEEALGSNDSVEVRAQLERTRILRTRDERIKKIKEEAEREIDLVNRQIEKDRATYTKQKKDLQMKKDSEEIQKRQNEEVIRNAKVKRAELEKDGGFQLGSDVQLVLSRKRQRRIKDTQN